ncbi:MAG: class I SAM-dependent methyltransferase [Marmoricola sp.]
MNDNGSRFSVCATDIAHMGDIGSALGEIIELVKPARPPDRRLADAFAEPGVADAYRHRPPYPPDVFDILERLISDRPRNVLDIGAGEGALARRLAARVDHLDAIDVSAAMVEAGRRRPGGRRSNLRWIIGAVESEGLGGPYALVSAGASLHWMAWEQVMPRLAGVLTDHGFLAVIDQSDREVPWRKELEDVIARHSRNPDFDPRVLDRRCAARRRALRAGWTHQERADVVPSAGRVLCGEVPLDSYPGPRADVERGGRRVRWSDRTYRAALGRRRHRDDRGHGHRRLGAPQPLSRRAIMLRYGVPRN